MESYFGDDFDKFLSHVRTILVKKKAMVNLLKEFDDNVYSSRVYNRTTKEYEQRQPLLKRGKETFAYIDEFFKIYSELFDHNHFEVNGDFDIYNYIHLMDCGLGTDYWVAPVMDYYKRYHTKNLREFLKALDRKISADWIISLSPTTRIENVNAVLQEIEKGNGPDELLKSPTLAIDTNEFLRIIQGDIYGKRFARYLMLKLDLLYLGNTTQFNPPSTISIEHILPQNPGANSQWRKDFTDEERAEWTDKIGNLALISCRKNTSQGNLDFKIKMKRYFEKNVEVFPSSIRIYNTYHQWTMAELAENHAAVIEKLKQAYC